MLLGALAHHLDQTKSILDETDEQLGNANRSADAWNVDKMT